MAIDGHGEELESRFHAFRIRQLKFQMVALQVWLSGLSVLLPLAGILILAYYCSAIRQNSAQAFWSSVMAAVGAMVVGGFLGFLFAIPRAREIDKDSRIPQGRRPFVVNTNFEQISDWLTKIIVGVTLIQLDEILAKLGQLTEDLAVVFGNQPGATVVAAGILAYFPAVGFLIGYVATRSLITVLLGWIEATLSDVLVQHDDQESEDIQALATTQRSGSRGRTNAGASDLESPSVPTAESG
ncbi:MAG TPA: hypothetical protein VJ625_14840 [Propionibacteriaceae bacterium]|nr:hypothetical protein [Propionibacteriaceae bacterium]